MIVQDAFILNKYCFLVDGNGDTTATLIEAHNIAINALKKQIPKKPIHKHKNHYCPECDRWLLWDDAEPNDTDLFCGRCGQAIDWRTEE